MPQVRVIESYVSRLVGALHQIDQDEILSLCSVLSTARRNEATVFIAGNGGSASTSEHIALDWSLGTRLSNPPLRVFCLSLSGSSITATGNDVSFEEVFSRQLEALGVQGDLLVVISASGNSPNLLRLVEVAKTNGVQTVALTGFDGGLLKNRADLTVHVPTKVGDYGVAEDAHLAIGHITKEILVAMEHSET